MLGKLLALSIRVKEMMEGSVAELLGQSVAFLANLNVRVFQSHQIALIIFQMQHVSRISGVLPLQNALASE